MSENFSYINNKFIYKKNEKLYKILIMLVVNLIKKIYTLSIILLYSSYLSKI